MNPTDEMDAIELRQELIVLRGALADLTTAHEALLNTMRRLSQGAIPNN